MVQGTQWPSFIIQGIVLSGNLWLLVEQGSGDNRWIFFSILGVLILFALQTTSTGFLYLYPVEQEGPSGKVIRKLVGIDTWILRVLTIISLFCFYMGILDESHRLWDAWLVCFGVVLILVIPIIFNMGISDYLRDRAAKK
jgi:hypothetical protein